MKKNLAVAIVFVSALGAAFILNAVTPDKEFSWEENRMLGAPPKLSVESVISGEFAEKFESYLSDQFIFRDGFIAAKAGMEALSGKRENNGVFFGKNGYLIGKADSLDYEQADRNLSRINEFAAQTGLKTYVLLVPDAAGVLENMLPDNAQHADERAFLDHARSSLAQGVVFVDIFDAMKERSGDYIYYRTDHHWTSLGSYIGCKELLEAMGHRAPDMGELSVERASDEFYGTLYSKSGARWVTPDSIDLYKGQGAENAKTEIVGADRILEGMFDMAYLGVKDKYSVFLGDNNALLKITGTGGEGRTLFIKDSFAHSLIPIYALSAEETHAADLRYLRAPLSGYCEQNGIDTVVFVYGVSNFCSDNNLVFLK